MADINMSTDVKWLLWQVKGDIKMAVPLVYLAGGVVLVALAGDGPFITTQVSVAHKLYEHHYYTVPGREMAAVQLLAKDYVTGVCIYG